MTPPRTKADVVFPLADDFPPANHSAWLRQVEAALRGKAFDTLVSFTADGVAYGPLHAASALTLDPPSRPATPDRDRPWDVRALVAHPSPARANAQVLEDLEQGAASVLLRLDPDGRFGVACSDAADLARVLDGVHTDLAPVALDAGALGAEAAQWLSQAARRGPAAPLAFHMDPLSAFARDGAAADAMEAQIAEAGQLAAELAQTHRAASFFLASGRVVHEAGGSEAQELGFAAACALAYARAGSSAGLLDADALSGVVMGLAADPRAFVGAAKIRAARLIAARLTRACGGARPMTIEALSSGRTLATLDAWTNLLRLTSAGFGAVIGGADTVILAPFTLPLTLDGRATSEDFARRQARNAQLMLMEEAHLGRVADPCAGAWFLDHLTNGLARAGWNVMRTIEAAGGPLAALRAGDFAADVARARDDLARDYRARRHSLVGVSEFAAASDAPPAIEAIAAVGETPELRIVDHCSALTPWRAAEPFERLRASASARVQPATAFIVRLGDARESAPRETFVRNLLAVAGVATELAQAGALGRDHRLVVLCGSDERYASEGSANVSALRASGVGAIWMVVGAEPSPLLERELDGVLGPGRDVVPLLEALQAAA